MLFIASLSTTYDKNFKGNTTGSLVDEREGVADATRVVLVAILVRDESFSRVSGTEACGNSLDAAETECTAEYAFLGSPSP